MRLYTSVDYDALVRVSGAAVLIRIDDNMHWVPIKLVDEDELEVTDEPGELLIEEWFAIQEGLV